MGLFSSNEPSLQSYLSKKGKTARNLFYAPVGRALSGQGFLPYNYDAIRRSYMETEPLMRRELETNLNRTTYGGDETVRDYARSALSRYYPRAIENLKTEELQRKYEEQEKAIGMGLDAVSAEKQVGMNITGAYNQALLNNQQMLMANGSAGSNMAGGIGYGAGQITGAQQWARYMSDQHEAQNWLNKGYTWDTNTGGF